MSLPTPDAIDRDALRTRVQGLQQRLDHALNHEFSATLSDLKQLRSMLGDATSKLSAAFQGMVRQARDQSAVAARLEAETGAEAAREITQLAKEISGGAMLVVQSLQFEDMASQLLQHVDRRVAWLDELARASTLVRANVHEGYVGLTWEEFLSVDQRITELGEKAGALGHKSVQQQSLDEGDIELF